MVIGRQDQSTPGEIAGRARVDSRTKNLVKRLRPGEIAVIDHEDIDRVAAESIVEIRPAAVLNAAQSTSGRYPNLGPQILVDAGIPLIDNLGSGIMDIREGQKLSVTPAGEVYRGQTLISHGTWQTEQTTAENLVAAKAGMTVQLKAFANNTMQYLEKEQELILDGAGFPDVATEFDGRHVLIVVRGHQYKEDLQALRPYIREYKPIMVGVDGGADAIIEAGHKPDMIIGDMDSVSDETLRGGAEVVVHAYRDGSAPGRKRVEDLGVEHKVFPATGTSEDIAMLLADSKGAELIVAVGTHSNLVDFLDKGRRGMASTFLTRLKVGSKLVDARGVSRLYRSRISNWQIAFLLIAGLSGVCAAISATEVGRITFDLLSVWWSDFVLWVKNLF
ncbi:putative cytokinetic ring protein SteA [Trueperella bialowiezensis]|uniref:Thiamine pyrophosphokinase n=1 Tax=Trueperella bialowiezensis TaxID=312285 RepID=A0A448PBQ4_9ACTO|nr:putative cytokinetic ring protein SteA [Trueperella bialowiezensis]VEI12334.1 Thiamine pyrophosphokinase [Trueperella bialowiezensis]